MSNPVTSPPAPGHAHLAPSAILQKPHNLSTSPPPPGSPMPPAASLQSTLESAAGSSSDSLADSHKTRKGVSGSHSPLSAPHTHTHAQTVAPPPEVEATLSKLTSHKNVTGCLVLSRPEALIIRVGGKDFEPSGPGAHDRSERLRRVVRMVKSTVDTLGKSVGDVDEGDDLGFIRIRTKKYEMMISPSDKYLLVVLQDPTISP